VQQIIVNGPSKLKGTVKVEGAKNAALPILAATLLASSGEVALTNIPPLSDVITMTKMLRALGADVTFDEDNEVLTVDASKGITTTAPEELVDKMRASIVV